MDRMFCVFCGDVPGLVLIPYVTTQHGMPSPPPGPPRSPWKKARRTKAVSGTSLDEDYFDEGGYQCAALCMHPMVFISHGPFGSGGPRVHPFLQLHRVGLLLATCFCPDLYAACCTRPKDIPSMHELTRLHTTQTDAMWISGEHFKFDQQHNSRCGSPNGSAGRLSFGTLNLSSHSETIYESRRLSRDGSDASMESLPDRLDASTLSPKNSSNANISSTSLISAASTKYSPSRARPNDGPPSPAPLLGQKLNMSGGSPKTEDRNNRSLLSNVATIAQLRTSSPVQSDSPLHPLRLFNSAFATPTNRPHRDETDESAMSSAATQSLSFALPPRRPLECGQYYRRRNPFLGVDAITHSPYDVSRLAYPSMQSRHKTRLTVRNFQHDFFDFQEIARDACSTVYRCYRKIDLCPYAVKEVRSNGKKEICREDLLREIYAHASQSDNIHMVRYYNAWEQEDAMYIQTELCDGTLDAVRLKQGPLHEGALKDILVQLAAGLAYMHSHNLAHLDVRPANMHWTSRGVYKLGGFRLVTVADLPEHIEQGTKQYIRYGVASFLIFFLVRETPMRNIVVYVAAKRQVEYGTCKHDEYVRTHIKFFNLLVHMLWSACILSWRGTNELPCQHTYIQHMAKY
jgi:hypothetical protein